MSFSRPTDDFRRGGVSLTLAIIGWLRPGLRPAARSFRGVLDAIISSITPATISLSRNVVP